MVGKKDFSKPKHDDLDVPNLQVIKLMQSLKSRGYVKETFNWYVLVQSSCLSRTNLTHDMIGNGIIGI